MGWLILIAYLAIGVWSARYFLRCAYAADPAVPLEGYDFVGALVVGVLWPATLPATHILYERYPKFPKFHLDARLRKFAGLPPRKEH